MRKTRVLGLFGLFATGMALAGCQSSSGNNAIASGGSTTKSATVQGWSTRPGPADPSSTGASGSTGLASRPGTPGASSSTSTIDPSALPRTSQDMLPRTVGNQLSSYTTAPNTTTAPGSLGAVDPPPAPLLVGNGFTQGAGSGAAPAGGTASGTNGIQPATFNGLDRVTLPPGTTGSGAAAQASSTRSGFDVSPPGTTIGSNAPDGLPRDPYPPPPGVFTPSSVPPPPGPR